MASWNPPQTLAAGVPLPSAYYNTVVNNELFLYERPYISVYDSVGTSIPPGGDTVVGLAGTTFSNYGWSITDNTLTVPISGLAQISMRVGFTPSEAGSGGGFCILFHNGNAIIFGSWCPFLTSNIISQSVGGGLLPLNQGDGLFLACYQSTAGDVNTMTGSAQTALEVVILGSL